MGGYEVNTRECQGGGLREVRSDLGNRDLLGRGAWWFLWFFFHLATILVYVETV